MIDSVSTAPEPGIYPDSDFEDYKLWPALNPSKLKYALVSMEHLRAAVNGEMEIDDTDDKRIGSAAHCYILEGEPKFRSRYLVADPCCGILQSPGRKGEVCGKKARYLYEDNWFCGTHKPAGAEEQHNFTTPEELARIRRMKESIFRHRVSNYFRYIGGAEVSLVWPEDVKVSINVGTEDEPRYEFRDVTVQMKGRVDKLIHKQTICPATIIDLKKCQPCKISLEHCEKAILNWSYHLQIAAYIRGVQVLTGETPDAWVIFVEDKPPYAAHPIKIDETTIEMGMEQYRYCLQEYAKCMATDEWPGVAPEGSIGGLPEWMKSKWRKQHEMATEANQWAN